MSNVKIIKNLFAYATASEFTNGINANIIWLLFYY